MCVSGKSHTMYRSARRTENQSTSSLQKYDTFPANSRNRNEFKRHVSANEELSYSSVGKLAKALPSWQIAHVLANVATAVLETPMIVRERTEKNMPCVVKNTAAVSTASNVDTRQSIQDGTIVLNVPRGRRSRERNTLHRSVFHSNLASRLTQGIH